MTFVARDLCRVIGERTLYRDLEFSLDEGQTLAVRGPSGAGKSQLLRQLAGLDADDRGENSDTGFVTLDGRSRDDWNPYEWRTEVCLVPQHVPRLEGTPEEFVQRIAQFGAQRTRVSSDPLEMGSRFGLPADRWQKPWEQLSVGERQRALLATMLSRKPRVLLLDEPTAALDPDAAAAVEQVLSAHTCVWVTHSPEQAERISDEILSLEGEHDAD